MMDLRQYATNDDIAIFVDDTLEPGTVKRLSCSPSAMAILSPQHDTSAPMTPSGAKPKHAQARGKALFDRTNVSDGSAQKQLRFGSCGISPLPCQADAACSPNPTLCAPGDDVVSLSEYAKIVKERDQYRAMYEYQKQQAEICEDRFESTYQQLQDKIRDVVALSSRNEESKRFIRQLKKEVMDAKSRALPLHNGALVGADQIEAIVQERCMKLLKQQEAQFAELLDVNAQRVRALESILGELSAAESDCGACDGCTGAVQQVLVSAFERTQRMTAELSHAQQDIQRLFDEKIRQSKEMEALQATTRERDLEIASERRRAAADLEQSYREIATLQSAVLHLREEHRKKKAGNDSPSSSSSNSDDSDSP